MHTNEIKDKFVELRALGTPMEAAAQTLGIARSTAFLWQRELKNRITNLRLTQLEAAQARVLGPYEERLKTTFARLQRYQREMDARDAKYMDMDELQMLIVDTRRELEKLTFTPEFLEEPVTDAQPEPTTQS